MGGVIVVSDRDKEGLKLPLLLDSPIDHQVGRIPSRLVIKNKTGLQTTPRRDLVILVVIYLGGGFPESFTSLRGGPYKLNDIAKATYGPNLPPQP